MFQIIKRLMLVFYLLAASGIYDSLAETSSYEASGRDEISALGNLKMTALRQTLKDILSPSDIKTHARELRQEVFLRVNELVKVEDDIQYRTEDGRIIISGSVDVDRDAVVAAVEKIPGIKILKGASDSSPTAESAGTDTAGVSSGTVSGTDSTGTGTGTGEIQSTSQTGSAGNEDDQQTSGNGMEVVTEITTLTSGKDHGISASGEPVKNETANAGAEGKPDSEESVSLVLLTAGFLASMFLM